MNMKPLFLIIFLLMAGISNAQESTQCETFLATPVGELKTAEIVKRCQKFAICGVDSQDMFNCVTPQVMSLLIFDAKEEDENFTYGSLLEELREYTAKPGYVAFKKKQTDLIKLLEIVVTNENWGTSMGVLQQNGFTADDMQNLKAIFERNPNDRWTYGDLMEYYNKTAPASDNR